MNIVLYGAGASFGSGKVEPAVPPLGNDLFDVLSRLFPTSWGKIPKDLSLVFRDNFEHGMEQIIQSNYSAVNLLMQKMAIFFADFNLSDNGNNLYIEFFETLKEKSLLKNTVISTLNYECLLELAANRVGLSVSYFREPDQDENAASIWKIHGSCNFQLTGIQVGRGVIINSPNVLFDGNIKRLSPNQVRNVYSDENALSPCMCLYAKNKPVTIAPSIIAEKQSIWSEKTIEAKTICVIGVRPNPEDNHIWEPIAKSSGKFVFIGSEEDFNMWTEKYRNSKENLYLGNRWDQCFNDIFDCLSC